MNKQRIALIIFLSGIVFLSMLGCGLLSLTAPKSTETIVPTATDTATYTNTPTRTPTDTLTPGETPSFTFTPSKTVMPTVTQTTLGIGSTMVSGKDGMVLVYVPEGEFLMGSSEEQYQSVVESCDKTQSESYHYDCEGMFSNEKPQHTIWLDAFWIDQTEVTNALYQKCVKDKVCTAPHESKSFTHNSYYGNPDYDNHPVIYVDWSQAKAYCTWAGRQLPSEAQWEKAARGTDGRLYPWGNDAPSSSLLNFNGNVGDTTEVGKYSGGASIYGALDMAGNVWEWVNDWYQDIYYQNSPDRNPTGPSSGGYRVLRGGSWVNLIWYVRASYRYAHTPDSSRYYLGFRCHTSP